MILHWRWPQFAMVSIALIGLLIGARNHGKPRTPESFWSTVIGVCLQTFLLIAGGFYR